MLYEEFTAEIATILGCENNVGKIIDTLKQREIDADMLSNAISDVAQGFKIDTNGATDLQIFSQIGDYAMVMEMAYNSLKKDYDKANHNAADYKLDCMTLKRALVILAKDID